MRITRLRSFILLSVVYGIALAAAVLLYRLMKGTGVLPATFLADVAATLVVWLFGVLLGNSSAYDPYWSVAPVAIVVFWVLAAGSLRLPGILSAAAVLIWGVRLTVNWARRWKGLAHEDWRYTRYKQAKPRLWFAINLFGINLMPTVLVFFGMIPVYFGITAQPPASMWCLAGFAICMLAALIELWADIQMDAYKKAAAPKSPYIAQGVWLWCRHPNYLGEMLFWWGLWLIEVSLTGTVWTIIGPVLITALFVFVSIPMMERHILETRPEYDEYIRAVPMLLPLVPQLFRKDKTAES